MAETQEIQALQTFIEDHVSGLIRETMEVEYVAPDSGPAVARFLAFGQRFRLEGTNGATWKLISDGAEPQIVARFEGEPDQFQRWLLLAIVDHTGGNGHKS
jgi:hypothetical protein